MRWFVACIVGFLAIVGTPQVAVIASETLDYSPRPIRTNTLATLWLHSVIMFLWHWFPVRSSTNLRNRRSLCY